MLSAGEGEALKGILRCELRRIEAGRRKLICQTLWEKPPLSLRPLRPRTGEQGKWRERVRRLRSWLRVTWLGSGSERQVAQSFDIMANLRHPVQVVQFVKGRRSLPRPKVRTLNPSVASSIHFGRETMFQGPHFVLLQGKKNRLRWSLPSFFLFLPMLKD